MFFMTLKQKLAFGLTTFLASSLLAIGASAEGAGSSGGGLDRQSMEIGSAWFPGAQKEIKFCYEVSKDFGAPTNTDFGSLIQEQFSTWKQYVNDRKAEAEIKSADLKLTFKIRMLERCDGNEDLKFSFGTSSPEIDKVKKSFSDPYSFAYREKFDPETNWGKGFIWVKPSGPSEHIWSNVDQLKMVVLHEIGHILGCDHVRGTIMSPDIQYSIESLGNASNDQRTKSYRAQLNYMATHIDHGNKMYHNWVGTTNIQGEIGKSKHWEAKPGFDPRKTFVRFVGRQPVGKIESTLHLEMTGKDKNPFQTCYLSISDRIGITKIPLQLRFGGTQVSLGNGAQLFKVFLLGNSDNGQNFNGHSVEPSLGLVLQGYVSDMKKIKLPVSLYLNTGMRPSWAEVDYADGLNDLPLFRATMKTLIED